MPRLLLAAVAILLAAALPAAAAAPAPARPPIPVILDTDIGDDIDDTWALVLALKSPEIDLRLVVTDFGNTEHRAKIVARLLVIAGRTDIPIGIGVRENDKESPQGEWVKGYDLARYPGRVLKDGVLTLVDTAMAAPARMALISIGPPPNLKAALEREPRLAAKLREPDAFRVRLLRREVLRRVQQRPPVRPRLVPGSGRWKRHHLHGVERVCRATLRHHRGLGGLLPGEVHSSGDGHAGLLQGRRRVIGREA